MGNKSKGSAAKPKKRKGFAGKPEEVVVRSDTETTGEDGNVPSTSSSTNADILNVSSVVDNPAVTVSTSKRNLDLFRRSVGTPYANYGNANSSHIMEPCKIFSHAFVLSLLRFVSCSECNADA